MTELNARFRNEHYGMRETPWSAAPNGSRRRGRAWARGARLGRHGDRHLRPIGRPAADETTVRIGTQPNRTRARLRSLMVMQHAQTFRP